MKKIIALLLVVAMTAAASVAGTIAYLSDTDSDVNVMTVGNVYIEQIEQERDEDGNLVSFTQGKPALPVVGPIEWATTGVNVNGTEYKVFTPDLKNVVDKIVTVKNTGRSDAYIRTVIAVEAPEGDPNDLIHINYNGTDCDFSGWTKVALGGVDYVIATFTYKEALAGKEISAPSLVQVFLDSKATNEDVEKFGDLWDIKVVSQAIQADGFATAAEALKAGFGDITAENNPWSLAIEDAEKVSDFADIENVLDNVAEGEDVNILIEGDSLVIEESLTISGNVVIFASNPETALKVAEGETVEIAEGASLEIVGAAIDLSNGGEIAVDDNATLIIGSGASISVDTGSVGSGVIRAYGEGCNVILDGAIITSCNNNGVGDIIRVSEGATLTIEAGTVISDNVITGDSSSSTNSLIRVGGTVIMNGGLISENEIGGKAKQMILMEGSGKFIMNGGEIINNTYTGTSSGNLFSLMGSSSFEMNGGVIADNDIGSGYVFNAVLKISGNNGAVSVKNGTIQDNSGKLAYVENAAHINISASADVSGAVEYNPWA